MPDLQGIAAFEEEVHGCRVTTVEVQTECAAERLGREVGSYITVEMAQQIGECEWLECTGECLVEILERVLRPHFHRKLCVCGLGNRDIPADSLGPEVTSRLPLSFFRLLHGYACQFREIFSITPGVFGVNNTPTPTLVAGAVQSTGADCLLLVDSIATPDPAKLFRMLQISTAGGTRSFFRGGEEDWASIGIPVLAIGIPTAIPLNALSPGASKDDMVLTSTQAASEIEALGALLTYALIRVCWPSLNREECFLLTKVNSDPLPYSPLLNSGRDQGDT